MVSYEDAAKLLQNWQEAEGKAQQLHDLLWEARSALAFYAEPKNYRTTSEGFAAQYDPEPPAIKSDLGRRAQKALAALNAVGGL